jgi:hypothetical protein
MNPQEKFDRFVEQYPHPHKNCFERPHVSRRRFFELAGAGAAAGVTLGCLGPLAPSVYGQGAPVKIVTQPVTLQNTAKNVIFILMAGAPSHTDMFDLKVIPGTTPTLFNPTMINGVNWPVGLMPKLSTRLNNVALVRSMQAWALVHTLAQTWTQIGRNPAAALGNIAPNIGSVVAIEKDPERTAGQVFPTFLSLNASNAAAQVGNGYFAATYAPFKIAEPSGSAANTTGIANTTNVSGQTVSNQRYSELLAMDGTLRTNSPYGTPMQDMGNFYTAATGLEYNPIVNQAFQYSAADASRYGSTSFGNACLVAKQALAANQGTRYIEIAVTGWDLHVNIYGTQDATDKAVNLNPLSSNCLGLTFDNGLSALMDDLQAAGILNDTLIVCAGEFGRTTGALTGAKGRDHYVQQTVLFAGGGIKGGTVIGATDALGANTINYGWSAQRIIKPEDIEATIYSAMGINYTTIRYDDPFGRGFEYVPFASEGVYQPINELWGS